MNGYIYNEETKEFEQIEIIGIRVIEGPTTPHKEYLVRGYIKNTKKRVVNEGDIFLDPNN